jgi:hypothetical protein
VTVALPAPSPPQSADLLLKSGGFTLDRRMHADAWEVIARASGLAFTVLSGRYGKDGHIGLQVSVVGNLAPDECAPIVVNLDGGHWQFAAAKVRLSMAAVFRLEV